MSQEPDNDEIYPDPFGPDLDGEGEQPGPAPEGEPFADFDEMGLDGTEGEASFEGEGVVHPEEPSD